MDHVSFYRFAPVSQPDAVAEVVTTLCEAVNVLGYILIAPEGINGMVAGEPEAVTEFCAGLQADAVNEGGFNGIVFKRTRTERRPFRRLKIKVKPELVPLGVEGFDPTARLEDIAAADVPPEQWRELIAREDVLLLDNRNHFEYQIGRFSGAIDPEVSEFRSFAEYVRQQAPSWREEGKSIAMYCTGGIRCEKSSAWMQDLGLTVYQLEGGILNYFQKIPDAERDWEGECFVFDNRVTLDTKLNDCGRTYDDIPGQFPDELVHPHHRPSREGDSSPEPPTSGAGTTAVESGEQAQE